MQARSSGTPGLIGKEAQDSIRPPGKRFVVPPMGMIYLYSNLRACNSGCAQADRLWFFHRLRQCSVHNDLHILVLVSERLSDLMIEEHAAFHHNHSSSCSMSGSLYEYARIFTIG